MTSPDPWDWMLHKAREHGGYTGPQVPSRDEDAEALAKALHKAARHAVAPIPGTGPRAYFLRVLDGEVPMP
jgi:hypothetical protein